MNNLENLDACLDISEKMNERFCKDFNIPIKIFRKNIFLERLQTYNLHFKDCLENYLSFIKEYNDKYSNEEEYFKEYNQTKEKILEFLKNKEEYICFNSIDMNKFSIPQYNISHSDIYFEKNNGCEFISIDMKKANFSALKHFSNAMFLGSETYENFISTFTENQQFIKSKYIRQVIFGNLNPKRQITYEKYLMSELLNMLITFIPVSSFVYFSNDELILKTDNHYTAEYVENLIFENYKYKELIFRVSQFTLRKLKGVHAYVKTNDKDEILEIKGVCPIDMPFVVKFLYNKEYTENDKLFLNEGRLSMLLEIPNISL